MTAAGKYDPRALAVARAIGDVIAPEGIFLFGSRARGDWSDASDIDVFTIAEPAPAGRELYRDGLAAGQAKAQALYGHPVKIDLVRYSAADFAYYRQARTHFAYHALKDGIGMDTEPVGNGNHYAEVAPNSRPDVEQRFVNYQRQVLAAATLLESGLGYEEVGYNFQRCLENAYKGLLAYLGYDDGGRNDWRRSHSLAALQEIIRQFPAGRQALEGYDFAFLDEFAVAAPYEGVGEPLPDEDGVLASIRQAVEGMMEFIAADSGAELPRYTPPGRRGGREL